MYNALTNEAMGKIELSPSSWVDLQNFILDTWKKLCVDYGVDVELRIRKTYEILQMSKYRLQYTPNEEAIAAYLSGDKNALYCDINLLDYIKDSLTSNQDRLMRTTVMLKGLPRKPARIESMYVMINEDILLDDFVYCMFHLEALYDVVKLQLLHEMGHCISVINIVSSGITYSQWLKNYNKNDRMRTKIFSQAECGIINHQEYIQKYYEIPDEAAANLIVGLTWEDIYNAKNKVYTLADGWWKEES